MLVGIIFTCDNIYMKADTYLEDRLDTLIDSMKNSQSSERGVLLQLEDQSDLTDFDIESYLNDINNYIDVRRDTMKEIYGLTRSLESSALKNDGHYQEQIKLLEMSENNLNDLRTKVQDLHSIQEDKKRDVQITTYYQKYYRAWSGFMMIFFMVLFINIGVALLVNRGLLPSVISIILLGISLFYLFFISVDLRRRDTTIFDEYRWNNNPNSLPTSDYSSPPTVEPQQLSSETPQCAASFAATLEESGGTIQCASGKIYDAKLMKCVIKPEETGTVENFVANMPYKTVQME